MRVTGSDVARVAGVSPATVSYVTSGNGRQNVSPATVAAVITAAADLGCRPNSHARALRLQRSDIVLFPLPALANPRPLEAVINACSMALARSGLTLVADRSSHPGEAARMRAGTNLDPAAIVDVGLPSHDPVAGTLRDSGVAMVSMELSDAGRTGLEEIAVQARTLQVQHLLDRGCRSLVMVAPASALEVTMETVLPDIEALVRAAGARLRVQPVEPVRESLQATVAGWYGVDGVVASNDELALALLQVMRQFDLAAPRDFALIGLDDDPLADIYGLSTIAFGTHEFGEANAAVTVSKLADAAHPGRFAAPATFVRHRQTT